MQQNRQTAWLVSKRLVAIFMLFMGWLLPTSYAQSDSILLNTSFENPQSISTPTIGTSGSTILSDQDFVSVDGRIGASSVDDGKTITFPTTINGTKHIEFDQGEIEIWYRPNYNSDDEDIQHALSSIGNVYDVLRIEFVEADFFRFSITDPNWNTFATSAAYRAPLWSAGEWVHIRATWDTASADDAIAIYVNDERVDEGGAIGGWNLGDESALGDIFVGSANASDEFPADGLISDLIIRGQPGESQPVIDNPPSDEITPPDDDVGLWEIN